MNMESKKIFQSRLRMLLIIAFLILSISVPVSAASTSVKTLTVGKTSTITGYNKVKSSKTSVAKVTKKSSKKYVVKALKKGASTLSLYNSKGKVVKKVYLLAIDKNSFRYNTSKLSLKKGKSKTVKATVQSGCSVKYSSSKPSVAKVNSKGKITAVKSGTATIYARVYYKKVCIKTFKKTVTVPASAKKNYYSLSDNTKEISAGDEFLLGLMDAKKTTYLVNVHDSYKWSVDKPDVISIEPLEGDCIITAKKPGTAYVTVKITGKNTETHKCKITVREVKYPGYSYEVYLTGPKDQKIYSTTNGFNTATGYNDIGYCLYIKTQNPNPNSFWLYANGKRVCLYNDGFSIYDQTMSEEVTIGSVMYQDIKYKNNNLVHGFASLSNAPGYVIALNFEKPIQYSMEIREVGVNDSKKEKTVMKFKVHPENPASVEEKWMDSVIASQTDSSMTPFQKMESVCEYLNSKEAGFTYLYMHDGYYLHLAGGYQGPYFQKKQWDSCISPDRLARFAEKIGGFSYIHNCYGDYARGTDEWRIWHYLVKCGIGEDIRTYSVCPSSQTGEISSWNYVDFNSPNNMTRIG